MFNAIGKSFELCILYAPQIVAFLAVLVCSVIIVKVITAMSKLMVRKIKTGRFTATLYRLERG